MNTKLPPGVIPLGLSRAQAALFCGLAPGTFDAWVQRGILPQAIQPVEGPPRSDGKKPSTKKIWNRRALELALDRLAGLDARTDDETAAREAAASHKFG